MQEGKEQHILDIQALRADLLAINVKLDVNSDRYMEKLISIEAQTIKTNGRVNGHDDEFKKIDKEYQKKFGNINKIIWMATGVGAALFLLPALEGILNKIAN